MKMLLIDAGNTRLKWAWLENGRRSAVQVINNTELPNEQPLQAWAHQKPDSIHVACVAPPAIRTWLEARLPDLAPTQFYRSPAQSGKLINAYTRASDLGVDRWCAMLSVPVLGQQAFILADCGTALTLDAVDRRGQHLGGCILASPDTALQALKQQTSLPLPQGTPDANWLNHNTHDALLNAQWLAAALAVEQFSQACRQKCAEPPRCFLTGGGSATLATMLPYGTTRLQHPVLDGLQHWIKTTTQG